MVILAQKEVLKSFSSSFIVGSGDCAGNRPVPACPTEVDSKPRA